MERESGLEKQAMAIIHDPYTRYPNTLAANTGSNTSPGDPHLIKVAGVDCSTTTSSLKETVMTIQRSSTITTENDPVPDALKKVISRRPTVSQPSDNGSISMRLLRCSPERGNRTRIQILETRRDTLTRRRASTEKAIYDLMWHWRPCSALYDLNAREGNKKIIARLNSELADIRREEHDVGLNLFRALKSQDEENYCGSGSTSLWVSRVTR
jgi:hypothetical protein